MYTEKQLQIYVKTIIICYSLSYFFSFLMPVLSLEQGNSIFILTIQKWQFTWDETEQV